MATWMHVSLAFGAGFGVGAAFFLGLWRTVERLPSSRRPATLLAASALVRTVGVVAVFYVVMGDRWPAILACLVGWLTARTLVVRSIRTGPAAGSATQEPPHAG